MKLFLAILVAACINVAAPAMAKGADSQKSKEYAHKCDNGNMRSCVNLAVLYRHGTGVPHDDDKAFSLLTHACNNGYKFACGYVGDLLYRGLGVRQNKIKGERMLRQGCRDGNQWTCDAIIRYGLKPERN